MSTLVSVDPMLQFGSVEPFALLIRKVWSLFFFRSVITGFSNLSAFVSV